MKFVLREIQFSDEVPYNSYFDMSPFSLLQSKTTRTVALWISDGDRDWDYWAQVALVTSGPGDHDLNLGEGVIAVSALNHETISSEIGDIVEACVNDLDLLKFFIYEDGH